MRLLRLSALVWSCALVACTATPGLRPAASGQASQGRASAAPAPAASGGGLSGGASGLPVGGPVAGRPAAAPLALPLRLLPTLPVALVGAEGAALQRSAGGLARDGAVLIANDGGGLIANDGGGLIANDGAGVVAAGAGNFRLLGLGYGLAQRTPTWEERVHAEVQNQAAFLFSLAFVVDQLLAKWGASGPRLGEWTRFSAQTTAFLDSESAVLAPVLAPREGQERHFAALARAEGGRLEAAFYLLQAPGGEPEASRQVLTLQAERAGEAKVHFMGAPLFAGLGVLSALRVRPEGHFLLDLRAQTLVGEGSMRFGLGSGEAYRSLGERRMRWALKREAEGFSFAGGKVVFRQGVVDGFQSALRVLPNGDGAFWQARGFEANAADFAGMKLRYMSHLEREPVALDQAPPAWYLQGEALATGPVSPSVQAMLPGPDAAASAALPLWPTPDAEAELFPFPWRPVAAAL